MICAGTGPVFYTGALIFLRDYCYFRDTRLSAPGFYATLRQ